MLELLRRSVERFSHQQRSLLVPLAICTIQDAIQRLRSHFPPGRSAWHKSCKLYITICQAYSRCSTRTELVTAQQCSSREDKAAAALLFQLQAY